MTPSKVQAPSSQRQPQPATYKSRRRVASRLPKEVTTKTRHAKELKQPTITVVVDRGIMLKVAVKANAVVEATMANAVAVDRGITKSSAARVPGAAVQVPPIVKTRSNW